MGGWKLEVFRMGMYITFPVAIFYIFNQPKYFEEWVVKTRKELYPHTSDEERKKFRDEINRRRQEQMEQELTKKLSSHLQL
ncbi:hypothetical protein JTE90_007450 [Oedothorax gibbosus]|uniref:Protein PET100 homolog, mitochondrial n=1 Tax=Oedothorax gibbosus TaxID=931172 RepID=A0AAV6U7E3_9ARAC|nr:hypothetical protein JTE90_007450 [Oedothorax gibbosus]